MSSLNEGNSQGPSQDNQQAAPAGAKQSGEQEPQTGSLNDVEQGAGIANDDLAYGEVRRADRMRQRQGGNLKPSER